MLGCDHGLVRVGEETSAVLAFPDGSRREARDVLSMALLGEVLHVATQRGIYTLTDGVLDGRGLPPDGAGGFDDLRAIHVHQGRLLKAWRTQLEGGEGPPDIQCFANASTGQVFAGTRDGLLVEVDGGPVRQFNDGVHEAPIRHLAWSQGALWVAAAGGLHRMGEGKWTAQAQEPLALCTDPRDRLWALFGESLAVAETGWPTPVQVRLSRPWCIAATDAALWIGARGALYRLSFSPRGSQT